MNLGHYLSLFPALIAALAGFNFIIAIHEFGHFCFARLFNIAVPTFSIGMGPVLFRKKIGSTDFCLSLIPAGGYVEIAGLAETGGQGEQALANDTSANSFKVKPYWQKALVLLGGIIFNILLGFTIHTALLLKGYPKQCVESITINKVIEGSLAQQAGISPQDIITGYNGHQLKDESLTASDFANKLKADHISLEIIRDGKKQTIDIAHDPKSHRNQRSIGISMNPTERPECRSGLNLQDAIIEGAKTTYATAVHILQALKNIFANKDLTGAGGPIMMIVQSFKAANIGFGVLLTLIASISIGLAMTNLLPLGVLDGGQLFFETLQAIFRRRLPESLKTTTDLASAVFLICLMLYLSYRDILALIALAF